MLKRARIATGFFVFVTWAAATLLIGCAHQASAPVPGSINSFDASAYRALSDAQATINSIRTCIKAKTFTPDARQTQIFDQLVSVYNDAETAYQLYHDGATAAPSQAQLQTKINALTSETDAAVQSGMPTPAPPKS